MVIFTTWVKIYSAEYFCNAGVYSWVGWVKLLSNFFHQVACPSCLSYIVYSTNRYIWTCYIYMYFCYWHF